MSTKDTAWQKRHQEEFEKHGLRWGHVRPTQEMKVSPWFNALSDREQDIVLFAHYAQPDVVSVDVSQSLGRHRPRKLESMAATVTPQEMRYYFSRQRLRVGPESLALQGIPWQELSLGVDPPVVHSLAGNAWTGTVCMAVAFGILAHVQFPPQSGVAAESSGAAPTGGGPCD